ncbi:hypothetical protein [Streptomyces liliifuscus]|uniref:Uncharacterized protein n=1 Tax=Streptomyces liliifuscus TaxID=2797636 RepID=A0A7T7L1Y9_9ACTN|nr:hypothetical protein [Streptomyces liliifuscus]QQM44973.1 hypothetical protein JEQ17_39950 [Streptomyces liliifuscus]
MTASSQTPHGTEPPPLIHVPTAQALSLVRQYDGLAVEEMAGAAQEQTRAEHRADARARLADERARLAEVQFLQERIATLSTFKGQLDGIRRMLAGRPGDDLVYVDEVLQAADGNDPRATAPLSVSWDGLVMGPSGDTDRENTLVPCTTAHGAQTFLVLDDDKRLQLGEQLLATLHTTENCHTPGCGTSAEDLDASAPSVSGWVCVQVAGTDGPARWWCNAWCANSAITAAGTELAALDRAAAVDPNEPAPCLPAPDMDTMALPAIAETANDASEAGHGYGDAAGGAR